MKIKNKVITVIVIIVACVIVAFAVGPHEGNANTVMSIASSTKSSMKMIYKSFDGEKYKTLNLKSGQKLDVNIDVTTESGELTVLILDKDKNEIYSVKNPSEKISKSIDIKESGKYTIKVEGKHSGSYRIDWDIN